MREKDPTHILLIYNKLTPFSRPKIIQDMQQLFTFKSKKFKLFFKGKNFTSLIMK